MGKRNQYDTNPPYPDLGAAVAKLRRGADRKVHGAAVEQAIRDLQRRELLESTKAAPIARREPLGAARLEAQRRELLAYPDKVRRNRSPVDWEEMYQQAMAEKHARALTNQ